MRPFHSFFLVFVRIIWRGTFVECDNDICAKVVLDLNGFFRSKVMWTAIDDRSEGDAIFIYFCEGRMGRNVIVIPAKAGI